MGGNSDNSQAVELTEVIILELLRDRPGDQVTSGSFASLELVSDRGLADLSFKAHLDCAEDVG